MSGPSLHVKLCDTVDEATQLLAEHKKLGVSARVCTLLCYCASLQLKRFFSLQIWPMRSLVCPTRSQLQSQMQQLHNSFPGQVVAPLGMEVSAR